MKRKSYLSWEPLEQSEGIYCSPACGAKCKMSDWRKATRAADRLVNKLGGDWTPVIWENFGWHWKIENRNVTVQLISRGKYEAELQTDDGHQIFGTGNTAKMALAILLAEATWEAHKAAARRLQVESIV